MEKKLSGNEIRQQFIDYFVERGHTAVRSASLVPAEDQTLLFTNAGMVQFKDVFLGTDVRPYKRACDSQKCMRVSGKHNDLDDVGRDDFHHTFFEMLGNWSFGDYYKKEAITWAWDLLTNVWGLDKDILWATCFRDEKDEIPTDEEAFEIWNTQPGMNKDHVLYFGRKENFWEMADTGPCGPCSEIHIDLGESHCNKKGIPGHICHVNGDCGRFLELWNLVFIQYNRLNETTLNPLTQHFVDTGMGFERIVSILQKTDSNYKTDLFLPMIREIQKLTKVSDDEMYSNFTPYRVIADHARASAFLIADGVVPGNIGRNYVCRMIIRRAVRFGYQLGLKEPFMSKVAEKVIENYGDAYPELIRMKESILHSVSWEEERFNKTLENGINQLNEIIEEMKKGGQNIIDGETCFNLYSTHGLPLEITYDIVREYGLDVDRKGFKKASEAHRIASGAGKIFGKMGGEDAEQYGMHLSFLKESKLLGEEGVICDPYQTKDVEAKLIMALVDGQRVEKIEKGQFAELIVSQTNFYMEMGGQVGDNGWIRSEDGTFEFKVEGIRRPVAGLTIHYGKAESGSISVGETVKVVVDKQRRKDIMRNHTATHLLHAALREVLGEEARQAGSLVAADHLRFDFNSSRALTNEELSKVETIVNEKILECIPVTTTIEKLDDAINEGVTAIFNEKYGEIVRVVRVEDDDELFSAELCGGTHVSNTGEIGLFMIMSEGSVSTGIRRIEAITGRTANMTARKNTQIVKNLASILNASTEEIFEKVENLQTLSNKYQKEIVQLQTQIALKDFKKFWETAQKIKDAYVLTAMIPDSTIESLRNMADQFKAENPNAVVVLGTKTDDGQVQFIAAVSDSLIQRGINAGEIIRNISALTGGKGGGRPNMAQGGGKDITKAQEALDAAVKMVREKLR
ncbi:MAG TPA: alanine--tRNA ligase [Flexilinea sp.]|nr:alanine--tRNA ligase [Flexilinea sp.]